MGSQFVNINISEENKFTHKQLPLQGDFNLSLSGTWIATVTVQRSFDNGATWVDVATFTQNGQYVGNEPEADVLYRIAVKTGEYTSGTVIGRLSQ
jgi:hypothetical protein